MSQFETEGETINRARLAKKLTQKELAKILGISQSMVSDIERGLVFPNEELCAQIVSELGIYNVDIFGLFGYEFEYPATMGFIEKYMPRGIKRFLHRLVRD